MSNGENGGQSATDGERIRILDGSQSTSGAAGPEVHRSMANYSTNGTSHSTGDTSERFAYINDSFEPQDSMTHNKDYPSKSFKSSDGPEVVIRRTAVDYFQAEINYSKVPEKRTLDKMKNLVESNFNCDASCLGSFFTAFLPVLSWIPKYKLEYALADVIAGFTIAILHVPQGMAYGILANLKPENGLYVSFFPMLIYFLFGTSRHISIGTFAVVSLMVRSAISKPAFFESNSTSVNYTSESSDDISQYGIPPTHLELATSLCLVVGFWQLFMGLFRLGSLSIVLSDQLVSGFTTAAAFHVAVSQLNDIFGLSAKRYSGPLELIYALRDILINLKHSNVATIVISAIAIATLALVKDQINDRFKSKLKMPLPIDLAVVVVATGLSYAIGFEKSFHVKIMGHIPTGLPEPVAPRLDVTPHLMVDGFAIAVVAFAIGLSMAKLFAKKHRYVVRPSQELVAYGLANSISSFFACYPCCVSLSRSLLQEKSGGKTQLTGVVSCALLLLVLLVLAPLFYSLPRCILAAVIIVALKGMFLQVKDFFRSWKISKIDAIIWLSTFLSTVFLDITFGLVAGILVSVVTVILRTVIPSKTILGNIPGTDLYLDVKRYNEARELHGVKIFHFDSALYFMNKDHFRNSLQNLIPLESGNSDESINAKSAGYPHHIIIDCSSFSYIDMSGLETLQEVMEEYGENQITVFLAGCSVSICDVMEKADFFSKMPSRCSLFLNVHDAVQFCINKE